MQTRALPDSTPGDVSDAESTVFPDSALQSTDDWQAAAQQIESGEVEGAIAREEAQLAGQNQPAGQATPPQQGEQPAQAQQEQAMPADLQAAEEDNGSAPPEIGIYSDVQPNPVTGQAPPAQKQEDTLMLPVTEPAPPAQAQEQEQVAEGEQTQEGAKEGGEAYKNYRLKGKNDVEDLALELRKKADVRGTELSLEDALRLARETFNVQEQVTPSIEDSIANDPELEGVPHDSNEINTRLREIDDEFITASEEMDFDKQRELNSEKHKLQDALPKLQGYQAQAEEEYYSAFNASRDRVLELYPAAKDNDGQMAQMIAQMDAELESSGDDRFYAPDKPLVLAREAAKRLGMFPQTNLPAKAQSKAPTPSASETPPRGSKFTAAPPLPASGNAGSQGVSQAPNQPDYENMTQDQYESLKDQFQN